MIYIGLHDGGLPSVFVQAKNKKIAKDMVYGYYTSVESDVFKRDIMIHKPSEYFEDKTENVVEILFI